MLNLKGVVLAGGLATRLPNKPLLPLRNLRPAITSAIDLFLRSNMKTEDIAIVIPEDSPICHVLNIMYENNDFVYIEQKQARGVPAAISLVAQELILSDAEKFIITYCDNVYDECEQIPKIIIESLATLSHSVISILDDVKSKSLSKYIDGLWVREARTANCIAGWLSITPKIARTACEFNTTEDLLNYHNGTPILMTDFGWWDIGTVNTYRAYLEGLL